MEEKISTLNNEKTSAVITSNENISAFSDSRGTRTDAGEEQGHIQRQTSPLVREAATQEKTVTVKE
jgi:hypothetical protein